MHAWHITETASYIVSRGFTIVTLQLPDDLLTHATQLTGLLQAECACRGHPVKLYVLADTTYNSLSVDEVAAQHIGAQCVIHYGRASMTRLSRLPAFFVFPEGQLDIAAAASSIAASTTVASSQHALIFLDQPLLHLLPQLQAELSAQLVERQSALHPSFAMVPSQELEPQQPVAAVNAGTERACCQSRRNAGEAQLRPGQGPGQAVLTHENERLSLEGSEASLASYSEQQPKAACCGGGAVWSTSSTDIAGTLGGVSSVSSQASDTVSSNVGESLAGYRWQLPSGTSAAVCCLVWVGAEDAPALLQLQMTYSSSQWVVYDQQQQERCLQEGLPVLISRALRRRYFLVEKARVANIVGILVGTLGVAGYRDIMQSVRQAAQHAGKKTYTFLMGKPSPAKLANFPEIEVFVMISDPQGQVLDSKEYLSPIVTPYEAMLAFSGSEWDAQQYRLDFDSLLETAHTLGHVAEEPRFSLVEGAYYANGASSFPHHEASTALAVRAQEALLITPAPQGRSDMVEVKSAAEYYAHKRTWAGVDTPLVGAPEKPVEKAVPGRVGRASGYSDEPFHQL